VPNPHDVLLVAFLVFVAYLVFDDTSDLFEKANVVVD